jgi:hypothetical protein
MMDGRTTDSILTHGQKMVWTGAASGKPTWSGYRYKFNPLGVMATREKLLLVAGATSAGSKS